MSTRTEPVECPRCGKVWFLQWGMDGIECNCHLYCSSGNKPADCNVTYPYNHTGQLGYPFGAHNKPANESDDILHKTGYCNTHNKYIDKTPVYVEVDWKRYEKQRLPKNLRLMKQ